MSKQRYLVSPVAKALQVLDAVANRDESVRLAAIAKQVGLPKTSVFRYLCTLEAAGYLERDPAEESYRVGARFRALGSPADALKRLRAAALPAMNGLRDRFDETVNLGVLRGGSIVYVEIVECRQRLRLQARVGGKDPVHSTALGRAILAHLPAPDRAKLLTQHLAARTSRTAQTPDAVETELAGVQVLGYAVESGENEEGAICIGAAILNRAGRPIAALSISAPETRMAVSRIEEVGHELVEVVRRVSELIA